MPDNYKNLTLLKRTKRFILRKLRTHYRLVIMNDDNFEIKSSIKLTPLNVLFVFSSLSLLFAIFIISLITFTPIKQYFYSNNNEYFLRKSLVELRTETDSLRDKIYLQEQYLSGVVSVLRGEIDTIIPSSIQTGAVYDTIDLLKKSAYDSILRSEMESREMFGILIIDQPRKPGAIEELYLFPPVKGIVSNKFNQGNHLGLDIVAQENSAIKATLDGKVIFSGYTIDDGFVIVLQHTNNLISVYKHNSVLLKKVGNFVKAGDVIGIIGNSGKLSQGPHLHFELWHDMIPLNPLDYISF